MARYIKDCDCAKVISEKFNIPLGDVIDVVYDIPTADVVGVVRCGKCKSFIQSKEDECAGTCNHPMSGLSGRICKSDFCSYGERRTDNDTL